MPPDAPTDRPELPSERPDARIATAQLLAVGAELLVGETRDTNSGHLARSLSDLGVEVLRMSQLPDDVDVIAGAVRQALETCDLVISTGGLGPTPDDLTREGIAVALGVEPHVDPALEAWLRDIWTRRGLAFSETNLKQAWLIPGATALANPDGTAPGWWVEAGAKVIIALPGPPRELAPMWTDEALPRLRRRGLGLDRAAETLRLTGIGESQLVDIVGTQLLTAVNPRVATYARADSVDVRISALGDGERTARQIVDKAIADLGPRIDPYVFARNEDGWPVALAARLRARRLATLEIGTGGYLGLLLGATPFLVSAMQLPDVAALAAVTDTTPRGGDTDVDVATLASMTRGRARSEVGLAAIARETGDDMRVEVGVDIEGRRWMATHSVFRSGDAGRRRSANAAAAELWRRLDD